MHKDRFIVFLESLRKQSNDILLDSIIHGYSLIEGISEIQEDIANILIDLGFSVEEVNEKTIVAKKDNGAEIAYRELDGSDIIEYKPVGFDSYQKFGPAGESIDEIRTQLAEINDNLI